MGVSLIFCAKLRNNSVIINAFGIICGLFQKQGSEVFFCSAEDIQIHIAGAFPYPCHMPVACVLAESPLVAGDYTAFLIVGFPERILAEPVIGKVFLPEGMSRIKNGNAVVVLPYDVQPCEDGFGKLSLVEITAFLHIQYGRQISRTEIGVSDEVLRLLLCGAVGEEEMVCSEQESLFADFLLIHFVQSVRAGDAFRAFDEDKGNGLSVKRGSLDATPIDCSLMVRDVYSVDVIGCRYVCPRAFRLVLAGDDGGENEGDDSHNNQKSQQNSGYNMLCFSKFISSHT